MHLAMRLVTREPTAHAWTASVSASDQARSILGESGSGQSVTLRAMMRLLPQRRTQIEGAIRIDGQGCAGAEQARVA
jgi:ABC-type glutathione transport system ATPase component